MAERKQVGMIDAALLDEADALAMRRGQTRRVFVERALQSAIHGPKSPGVIRRFDAERAASRETRDDS